MDAKKFSQQEILKRLETLEKQIKGLFPTNNNSSPSLKGVMIMYNADADKEIFSSLRTSGLVKHYIKWEKVKGTGSGGMSVIGPVEESEYCIVLIILPPEKAEDLYQTIQRLRSDMLKKTGVACLIYPIEKIE